MDRRAFIRETGTIVAAGFVTFAGCSGDGDGQSEGTSRSNVVEMVTDDSEYYFDPIGLFVKKGDTITWRIKSGAHSSTAYEKGTAIGSVTRIPAAASAWNSKTLSKKGATFEHTFETTGTYDYYCIPHKSLGMVGRLVVGKPGGPAQDSMPPDGTVPDSQTIVEKGTVPYAEFGSN